MSKKYTLYNPKLEMIMSNSINSWLKKIFMIFIFVIFFTTFADKHYDKIISLKNTITENTTSTDKLKLYIQILDEISLYLDNPIDKKEVEILSTISKNITVELSTLLRHEEIIYKFAKYATDKNLKEDNIIVENLVLIIKFNRKYRKRNLETVANYYWDAAECFEKRKNMQYYVKILHVIFLITTDHDVKTYIKLIKKFFDKHENDNFPELKLVCMAQSVFLRNRDNGLALRASKMLERFGEHKRSILYQYYTYLSMGNKEKSEEFLKILEQFKIDSEKKDLKIKSYDAKTYERALMLYKKFFKIKD